jgi:hypothetical protein
MLAQRTATHVYMRLKASEMNCLQLTARYILMDYNGNEGIRKINKKSLLIEQNFEK